MKRKQRVELPLLLRIQVYQPRQQQPSLALHKFPLRAVCAEDLDSAHFIHCCSSVLRNVKFAIDDAVLRQPLLDALPERTQPVYTGCLDRTPLEGT